MLFLLCKSGENKEVSKIPTINQSMANAPQCAACSRRRGPGVFRTSGRRGRCAAGAPTPRVSPGQQGGGHPLPSQWDPLSGSPSRQGSGDDPARGAGPEIRVPAAARAEPLRAGLCAAPRGRGAGPGAPHPPRGPLRGLLRGPGRGRGAGRGAGRCRGRLSARRAAARPGRPDRERSSRTPLAQCVLGRERRILAAAERNNQIFIRFPARRFTIEYTSYLIGNLPENHK